MMENIAPLVTQLLAAATVVAVITLAISEVVKQAFQIDKRFIPIVSIIIGIGLGYGLTTVLTINLAQALWLGGISGLVASGAYDNAKKMISNRNNEPEEGNGKDENTN